MSVNLNQIVCNSNGENAIDVNNTVFLIVKQFIYCSKCLKIKPSILQIKNEIRIIEIAEKYNCKNVKKFKKSPQTMELGDPVKNTFVYKNCMHIVA